jgi:hypothetical protein
MFKKLNRQMSKWYLFLKFKITNKFLSNNLESQRNGIIISLTSFSGRIDKVYLTIESIFSQKLAAPQKVILWLSIEEFPNKSLPNSLIRLQSRGLDIFFVENNFKSFKKLIYSYKLECWSKIITIDDDIFYPAWWLCHLLEQSEKNPSTVVCYRGHFIQKKNESVLVPYKDIITNNKDSIIPEYSLMPTGVGGVLYPKDSLSEDLLDHECFLKLCPNADDIWFKAITLLNNKKVIRVFPDNINFLEVPNTQHIGLFNTNLDEDKNDEQLKNVFDYFEFYNKL